MINRIVSYTAAAATATTVVPLLTNHGLSAVGQDAESYYISLYFCNGANHKLFL